MLLGSKCYSTPADIWSFGCIIYEVVRERPLFPGNSTVDQLEKIIALTGYPSDEDIKSLESELAKTMIKELKTKHSGNDAKNIMKDVPPQIADFLMKILVFNPKKRLTLEQILSHPIVENFRKKEDETETSKMLTTSIDDNHKLTVEEYRKMIYRGRKGSSHHSSLPNLKNKTSLTSSKRVDSASKVGNSLNSSNTSSNVNYGQKKLESNSNSVISSKYESPYQPKSGLKAVKSHKELPKYDPTKFTSMKYMTRKSETEGSLGN